MARNGDRPYSLSFLILLITLLLPQSLAQPAAPAPFPPPANPPLPPPPPPQKAACNGVFVSYVANGGGSAIAPTNPSNQAYRFSGAVTVTNNDVKELKAWRVFVGFQFDEVLVSADKAVLDDGSPLPAAVGKNGTVLAGFPQSDLKTAIQTAGDSTQTEVQVQLIGSRFGPPPNDTNPALPANITLRNAGYSCPDSSTQGNMLWVCCQRNDTAATPPTDQQDSNFLPRQSGDLIIMYDILSAYDTNYLAQVAISNNHPLARLDNWQLSWEWMRDEFIFAMRGAYPLLVDTSECIYGSQGQHYLQMDFSQALNCQRRPTIIDLPPTRANDSAIGRLPFCCRNGTILPPNMDPTKSTSVFQMQVYKMPPDLNRTGFVPPQNWGIVGTLNPDFQCASPLQVSPTQFPDPSGLPSTRAAVASWQVVCNIKKLEESRPKCCVSFSAFYNSSIIPCNTCACGCNQQKQQQTCNPNEEALFMPFQSLSVPYDNRTITTLAWADTNKRPIPNPVPCGDNCGVSINWHLVSDFREGWTTRITVFNWGQATFADWFAAVQLADNAVAGFEDVYSFNGTVLPNSTNTIFMQGLPGLNFLLPQRPAGNPKKDFPVPGMLQSVMSFTKKHTPLVDVVNGGDGFPTKVVFNGEECVLPTFRPSHGHRTAASISLVLCLVVTLASLVRY
ncbi:unnamed protein product [Linum tenue]|uniref:COBRA C-terminal domain-containing protein n=1 Tax=Linum tenue TaxID=586396 RepID=A0AAV0J033_9ROSI|nr:unnamed protein product [Linum tenue]